jgi:hypothetical protein
VARTYLSKAATVRGCKSAAFTIAVSKPEKTRPAIPTLRLKAATLVIQSCSTRRWEITRRKDISQRCRIDPLGDELLISFATGFAACRRCPCFGRPWWTAQGDAIFLTNFETVSLPAMVIASANTHAWESRRLLDAHVFTPLALVLPTEPLRIAFRGWHTDDPALRGTALEYLENVLPHQIRDRLWPKRRAATAPRNMG